MINKRLINLTPQSRRSVLAVVSWRFAALLAQICSAYLLAHFLERLYLSAVTVKDMAFSSLALLALFVFRAYCENQAVKSGFKAGKDIKRVLRQMIFKKLYSFGQTYHECSHFASVIQVATEGVEQLESYFSKYLPQFFYSLLAPLTLFAVLAFYSFKASVILLITVPLIPLSIIVVQKIAKKLLSNYWNLYTDLGDSFLENVQGLTTLKIYQADERKAEQMDREAESFRKVTMRVLTMQLNSISVMDLVAYGGAALGMIVALSELRQREITLAGTVMVLFLSAEFFLPLRLLGSFFHISMNGLAASEKIFALLDLDEPPKGKEVITVEKSAIVLDQVSFGYQEDQKVLKGINLEILPGDFTAIVGESGSGKSTLASLITAKYSAYSGKIRIGGQNVSELRESSILQHIQLITHKSYLFQGTIAENLKMGKPEAGDSELWQVLNDVNLADFVASQGGLDMKVLEKAANLSGGQRQRLAFARALLADALVYILDEATSNIDSESEQILMNLVQKMKGNKTIILISHRLANAALADQIYVLEHGSLAESGGHLQLMEKRGIYFRLYSKQKELEGYRNRRICHA